MSDAQTILADPDKAPTESLKAYLRIRHFHIPNLDWMSRTETLKMFRLHAMPKPQRRSAAAAPPEPQHKPQFTSNKRHAQESHQLHPADIIDRMTGDCKRIRINSSCSTETIRRPEEQMDVTENESRSRSIRHHQPITWP